MLLVGESAGLVVLLALWGFSFVRRTASFTANRTMIAIFVFQLALSIGLLIWTSTAARPDLVTSTGWLAIGLSAFVVPLAVGAVLDGRRARARNRVIAAVLAVVTVAAVGGTLATAIAPALTVTTIAGRSVPVNGTTLANGYSMSVHIPATSSGFPARNANLWVPPGWILHPDVRRPVVEMMMGQPGNPSLGATLDALHALGAQALRTAPFVLVVDQLGGQHLNPPCRDTSGGKVATYLSIDVPRWIRDTLPVPHSRTYWTIAGYSHGGDCAEFLEASSPQLWSNVLLVSPPDQPGTPHVSSAIKTYWGGDKAAFDAVLTENVLRAHGHYNDTVATFASGALDTKYGPGVIYVASVAEEVGWHVSTLVVPDSTHVGPTLSKGLEFGYRTLFAKHRFPSEGAAPERFLCGANALPADCAGQQAVTLAAFLVLLDLALIIVFGTMLFAKYLRATPRPGR